MAAMRARAAALALVLVALSGCTGAEPGGSEPDPGLANPASEHCVEVGGRVDIREDADGNQYGFCVFPDGSECDEWALYRGECEPGE